MESSPLGRAHCHHHGLGCVSLIHQGRGKTTPVENKPEVVCLEHLHEIRGSGSGSGSSEWQQCLAGPPKIAPEDILLEALRYLILSFHSQEKPAEL